MPRLPLINDLRNPSLAKRHWLKINDLIKTYDEAHPDDKIGFTFDEELNITLKFIFEHNIDKVKDEIAEYSDMASREKGFERILNRMR